MPEAATIDPPPADAFAAAAKELAARQEPTVTPPIESPEAGATEASEVEGDAAAESPDAGASEVKAKDGDDADVDGLKALRTAMERDPTLAAVPEIRQRLGLSPIGEATGASTRQAPAPAIALPTEDEVKAEYDARMKAGDETGAVAVVARAAAAAALAPIAGDLQALTRRAVEAEQKVALAEFKSAHKDWKSYETQLAAEVVRQRQKHPGSIVDLEDVWKIVVRPGPAPKASVTTEAAKAAQAALDKTSRAKTSAAASAAGAPTNQRSAPVPGPTSNATPMSPAHRALAKVFGDEGAPKSTPLYDPKLRSTLPLRR